MSWSSEDIAQLDLGICREVLREHEAKLWDTLDSTIVPNIGTGIEELNRCWPESVPDRWSMIRRYMEIFISAKNLAPSSTVVDPMASGEVHRGIYRQAFIRRLQRNGVTYIVQTLRRGLMTTPNWSEARIFRDRQLRGNTTSVDGVNDTLSNVPEKYIYIEFFAIDPSSENTFMSGLVADTYADPVVGEQTLSGTWHNLGVTLEPTDDGTLTARLLLARPQYTLKAFADIGGTNESDVFYLWNVPKAIAQQIISDFKSLGIKGSTVTASYNTEQGVVDIVFRKKVVANNTWSYGVVGRSCSYSETQSITFNVSDPSSVAIPSDALTMAENVGVVYRREVRNNGDGTFDVSIIRRERLSQGPLNYKAETSKGRDIAAKETRGWKNGYAAYNDLYPQQDSPPQGTMYTREIRINEDCTLDIVDRTIVSKPLNRMTYRKTTEESSESTGGINVPESVVESHRNREPEVGETIVYDERENPDGSWTYDIRIDSSANLESRNIRKVQTKAGVFTDTADGFQNDRTEPNDPADDLVAPGKTLTFVKRKNADGTWDHEQRIDERPTTTGKNVRKTPTGGETEAEVKSGEREEPYTTPDNPSQGQIITIEKRENLDGSWEATRRVDTSPILENYELVETLKRRSEGEGVENARDPMPEPVDLASLENGGRGKTVRFRRRKNEDGTYTYNQIIESTESATYGAIEYEVTACRGKENETTIERGILQDLSNYEANPPPPGTIRTVRLRENEDGSWDREVRDRAAPNLAARRVIKRGTKTTVESDIVRNANPGVVQEPPAESRKRITYETQENPDCSIDEIKTVENIPLLEDEVRRYGLREVEQVISYQNTNAKLNAQEPDTDIIKSYESSETEDGLWNTTEATITPIEDDKTIEYRSDGRLKKVRVLLFKTYNEIQEIVNNECGPSTPTLGRLYFVDLTPTRYRNLWNATITMQVMDASGGGGGGAIVYYDDDYEVIVNGVRYYIRIIVASTPEKASEAFDGKEIFVPPNFYIDPGLRYLGRRQWRGCYIGLTPNPPN